MQGSTKKAMIKMLICVLVIFSLIFVYKAFQSHMTAKFMAAGKSPVVTVSAMQVQYQKWQPYIRASGSLRAVRGVDVTTELAGMVRSILFIPGADVKAGDLLVELNIDTDVAQLHSLQANEVLAETVYKRDKAQYAISAVSKATLDSDTANLKSLAAQVTEQEATIDKKLLRAPFAGRLGINLVNPGQYLNPGDKVVTLQSLDPIYVDFYLPQQQLVQVGIGQVVHLTTDTYPGQEFTGKVTTINPEVDTATRNVQVEATFNNPHYKLLPGMFGTVNVVAGAKQQFLTLPQSAVSFNPYGELVYVIKGKNIKAKKSEELTVQQQFITVGETRGDQVAVLNGLQPGDWIVTSGQLKLRNGSRVAINNQIQPSNNPAPRTVEE
ncbi:MAG TPA: efflux RND transporter periplasmic adaptor subunit [Gammaproteobacteria bacterium]|nr:efflux RND transporter periplasmic adaptor subunit [Gammaproteobacteria bacterium]